jgi:hypothetical protein
LLSRSSRRLAFGGDLLRQRISPLCYEDLIDYDALRFDPAPTAVLDKSGGEFADQSTLNRLEHPGSTGTISPFTTRVPSSGCRPLYGQAGRPSP